MQADAQDLDGKYRLGRVLKQGDRAIVVAATHLALRDQVVIKVLHAGENDPRLAAKLRRAARQSAALRSEHVVRYLDVGYLVDDRPYVVMERLVGETLSERIARAGPLSVVDAASVMLQACEALACAHVRGILHRDLRASNLFFTEQLDGRIAIKVLNFGTSRAVDASGAEEDKGMTTAALAVDSPDYKAPEQIVARSKTDTRTDTWALGVILYEMLTGVRPFAAATPLESVRQILSAEVPPDERIPPQLAAVIRGCIALRREERWESVGQIADAVAAFAGPETSIYPARIRQILATPPPPDEPAVDSPRDAAPVSAAAMLAAPNRTIVMPMRGYEGEEEGEESIEEAPAPPSRAPRSSGRGSRAGRPRRGSRASQSSRSGVAIDTESGLPRLDDGHNQRRSNPWMRVDDMPVILRAREREGRAVRIAIFVAVLLVVAVALAIGTKVILDFVRKPAETEVQRPVTGERTPPTGAAPAPSEASNANGVAPRASATSGADDTAGGAAASAGRTNAATPPRASQPAPVKPTPPSRSARPKASEDADPWGWAR